MTYHSSLGIPSIFDTVFRYLLIFLAALQYWITPNYICLPREVIKGGGHVPSEKVKIAYYPLFMSLGIKLFPILLEYVFAYDVRYLILLARVLQLEIDTNTYQVSSSKMLKINTP